MPVCSARALIVLLGACLSAGCSRIGLPQKLEIESGRLASKQLLERFPENKNKDWHDYIAKIGGKIARVTERPDFDYRFFVIDTPIINAFSLPDGSILVTTGILKLMKGSELALAGVIAHEIGHIARRHSAEKLQAQLGYRGASFFFFGFHTTMASRGAQVAVQLADLGYGRDMELEADLCAVRYLSRLGFPPADTVAFLRKIRQTEMADASSLTQSLQNHPPASERLQYAQAYIHRELLHEGPATASPAVESGIDELLDLFKNYVAMVYENMGLASFRRKAYAQAIAELTESINRSSRRLSLPNTYNIRASVYLEIKDYAHALADYDKSIELNPWDSRPYYSRGMIYASMGDWGRSFAECSRAIEVDPDFAKAYHCRAFASFRKNDLHSVIADDTRALVIDGKDAAPFVTRGWAYLSLGDYDRAIDDLNRALNANPKDAASRMKRAAAYLKKRNPDLALADYTVVIEAGFKDPGIYAARADAYVQAREYVKAVKDCSMAIELATSNFGNGYLCRASAYRANGDYENARSDAARAVALSNGSARARGELAWTDFDSGRYTSAMSGFKALLFGPDPTVGIDAKVGIALVLLKQKKRAAAVAAFRELAKSDLALAEQPVAELAKKGADYTDKEKAVIEALAALARAKPVAKPAKWRKPRR